MTNCRGAIHYVKTYQTCPMYLKTRGMTESEKTMREGSYSVS